LFNGRMAEVSGAALNQSFEAVKLVLELTGMLCLWSGIMRVADEAKLTEKISRIFSPVTKRLFKGLNPQSPAAKAMCMNITANLLGLGNAATPLGIQAMKELSKAESCNGTATNNMVMFVVLNTASLQILPTTTAILRANAGSPAPLDILPAVWAASTVSICAGVAMAKLLAGIDEIKPFGANSLKEVRNASNK